MQKSVSYLILFTLPNIYLRQKRGFNVKYDVEDFFLTVKEDNVMRHSNSESRDNSEVARYKQVVSKLKESQTKMIGSLKQKLIKLCLGFYQIVYYYSF